MRITRYALLPLAVLALSACGINSVPTAEENAKAKWGDVENQYQRRADLVPNLVSTVKAGAASEEDPDPGDRGPRARDLDQRHHR